MGVSEAELKADDAGTNRQLSAAAWFPYTGPNQMRSPDSDRLQDVTSHMRGRDQGLERRTRIHAEREREKYRPNVWPPMGLSECVTFGQTACAYEEISNSYLFVQKLRT